MTSRQPDPIWVPTGRDIAAAGITAFAEQAAAVRGYRGESYLDLWRWSVEHLDDFWAAVWDHFDVHSPLNRNGVRMGSAEIYRALEALPEITEALVVGVEQPEGGYWMPLFVALADGVRVDQRLRSSIQAAIGEGASPRHLPDDIIEVAAVPHTLTGKKLEIPIKRILLGQRPENVVDLEAVDRPDVLIDLAALAPAASRS